MVTHGKTAKPWIEGTHICSCCAECQKKSMKNIKEVEERRKLCAVIKLICLIIMTDKLIWYNLTDLYINGVINFLLAFLPGWCRGNAVLHSLSVSSVKLVSLHDVSMSVIGQTLQTLPLLHECTLTDMWVTEMITSFIAPLIRLVNVWASQPR